VPKVSGLPRTACTNSIAAFDTRFARALSHGKLSKTCRIELSSFGKSDEENEVTVDSDITHHYFDKDKK
jgi:hypothetical protein